MFRGCAIARLTFSDKLPLDRSTRPVCSGFGSANIKYRHQRTSELTHASAPHGTLAAYLSIATAVITPSSVAHRFPAFIPSSTKRATTVAFFCACFLFGIANSLWQLAKVAS